VTGLMQWDIPVDSDLKILCTSPAVLKEGVYLHVQLQ
jgi:hypothetical protein